MLQNKDNITILPVMIHSMDNNLPESFASWLDSRQIASRESVAGGSICRAEKIVLLSGECIFLKTLPGAPADLFATEAKSLQAIASTKAIKTPAIFYQDENCIAMEHFDIENPTVSFWIRFGQQLAAMHQHCDTHFGFSNNNYCGANPQINTRTDNGYEFFAQYRLLCQAEWALQDHLLSSEDMRRLNMLCNKLPELIPEQPASLIHGDLWSGNQLCTQKQTPALIDPATHYCWREADIAMTQLFGSFNQAFYRSYNETYPMESGWQKRLEIYNLYHLLNHINLFGRSYYHSFNQILQKYT